MTTGRVRNWKLLVALLGMGLGSAALADGLKKLPPEFVMPPSAGSPGSVAFRHDTHVDSAKPSCVGCHPKIFRILEKGETKSGDPITHKAMEAGRFCGACHGKAAFNFDSCNACHRM
jgi:c(7)-type cytochrome triheme protein